MRQRSAGFTVIEFLIIGGIIAILVAVLFVTIDPARRFVEARNAQRLSSVTAILNAYLTYSVENRGAQPVDLVDDTYYMIGTGTNATGCVAQPTTAVIDLGPSLAGAVIASIPYDPGVRDASSAKTYYYINRTAAGRITVGACVPEVVNGATPIIAVSR